MDKQTKSNMPLDESKLSFEIPRTDEPREKILKLGAMITDRMGAKITGNDPEYWGFAGVVTDEMADVALKMKVRQPKTTAQIARLNGKTEEELEKLLTEMAYIGIVEYSWENLDGKNPNNEKRWSVPQYIPGSAEFLNMRTSQLEEHPELAAFFERMTFLPLEKTTPMVPPGGAGIGMHVIPVEKAIEAESKSVSIEHISYWLKKYDGVYAASPCSCRMSRAVLGEGCGDDPENWCIGVGDMARYLVETGRGHYITYDEVMETLRKAEENGFVHEITNIDGEDKIIGICNCNVNVCNALRTSQLFNTPNLSRSAYVARVDSENCVACGRCVETCPAGAVKLGQKLCTKEGPIQYPRHELPDETKWGPEKWDINYRDNNRINCYDTGTSPCKTACPAHIAVQGYLKLAAQGKYREALQLIKRENPFPAVCGRICNRRCEDACTRGTIDRAVSIDAVKRFIAKKDLDAETRFIPPIVVPASIHRNSWEEKIAIIGAGPAGLSAAFYLAEKGYKPTVFEKESEPGGMLRWGIPSYKLEKDVIAAEIDVMREMGVEIRTGVEVGKDITLDELRAQGYKAFYIAIGCNTGSLPNVPNDKAEGTMTALQYLHDANCGGTHYEGRVAVIGGGNVAVDAARVSKRSGAAAVTMMCLESEEEMPASKQEQAESREDGVDIRNGWGPKEVLVDADGKVTGIVMKKCVSVYNEEHRFSPVYDENQLMTIECDRVIFAIGQRINWGDLVKGSRVEFGRGNGPVADNLTYQTAEPDIFVGGDVFTGPKFAIDAIAQGKFASESLHRFVQGGHMTIGRNRWEFVELDKHDIMIESYDRGPRQEEGVNEANVGTFHDAKVELTEEQVKAETARCLGCGMTIVDPNKCIGCGVCTTKCMFDAITLHRDRPECSEMTKAEDKFKKILPYQMKRAVRILFNSKKDQN